MTKFKIGFNSDSLLLVIAITLITINLVVSVTANQANSNSAIISNQLIIIKKLDNFSLGIDSSAEIQELKEETMKLKSVLVNGHDAIQNKIGLQTSTTIITPPPPTSDNSNRPSGDTFTSDGLGSGIISAQSDQNRYKRGEDTIIITGVTYFPNTPIKVEIYHESRFIDTNLKAQIETSKNASFTFAIVIPEAMESGKYSVFIWLDERTVPKVFKITLD